MGKRKLWRQGSGAYGYHALVPVEIIEEQSRTCSAMVYQIGAPPFRKAVICLADLVDDPNAELNAEVERLREQEAVLHDTEKALNQEEATTARLSGELEQARVSIATLQESLTKSKELIETQNERNKKAAAEIKEQQTWITALTAALEEAKKPKT